MHCRIPLLSLVVALSAAACSVNAGQGGDPSPPAASSGGESETQASAALAEQPEPAPAELAAKPAEPPPPPTPTVGAMVTHPIKDFDTWKQHFDTHEGKRARAGIVGHSVGLDADRRKSVVVYFAATDLDALRQFLESPR
jgi:type IV secretory pathway VirB10-like protein